MSDEKIINTANKRSGIHHLKSWPEYFKEVEAGVKPYEVRENDRDFRVGDEVQIHEWDPDEAKRTGRVCDGYTGQTRLGTITCITDLCVFTSQRDVPIPSARRGSYVVLGIKWNHVR